MPITRNGGKFGEGGGNGDNSGSQDCDEQGLTTELFIIEVNPRGLLQDPEATVQASIETASPLLATSPDIFLVDPDLSK